MCLKVMNTILQSHATAVNYQSLASLPFKLEVVQILRLFENSCQSGRNLELLSSFHGVSTNIIPNDRITSNYNLSYR